MASISQIRQKMVGYLTKAKNIFWELFVPNESNAFRPRTLKSDYLFWYASGLLIVKIALITLALILPATNFFSSIAIDRLVTLINQERQNRNLPALTLNTQLNSAADFKVNDMLAKNYFEHTSPSGITPWHWFRQIGYNFAYAGENLAMGFTDTDKVFWAWMNSPTHRDNILNPNFKEMGLAVKSGAIQNHADTLAVLVFGRPASEVVRALSARDLPQETAVSTKINTPTPTAKKIASALVAPSVAPKNTPMSTIQTTPSQTPIRSATTIAINSPLQSLTGQGATSDGDKTQRRTTSAPGRRVLGAFVSKSDEIGKSLYLYFTLFMAIALAVNIFVKIEIQYWMTIFSTTLVILLSVILIFI